jgi:CPA1 family monovalent cation:H+ antiporter
MTFFESLLALLTVAVLLLQISRRLAIPYPTMLAAAGVLLALVPAAPRIGLDPRTALPLFVAPALVDAAFDFPIAAIRSLWRPLFALAVLAVLLSAGAVAWLGIAMAGLPLYAALALGAIVAPPDAAAATAILRSVRMPHRAVTILKGESLLNDATALLLFSAALSLQQQGAIHGGLALRLGIGAPGGVLLGIVLARLVRYVIPFLSGTLGGNLFEFLASFGVWIIADRLGLSAVLCLVAFAMSLARAANLMIRPRTRIHSYAVWDSAVFLLNVLAFLLMGLQARSIVGAMAPDRLRAALWFAASVFLCLTVVRMAWVLLYSRIARHIRWLRGQFEPASWRNSVLVGWCGMRGLVTLATAFALSPQFPQRDLIVLTAFTVVLATLVLQGLTLAPLVRLLGLDREDGSTSQLSAARAQLAAAALAALQTDTGPHADHWRYAFETARSAVEPAGDAASLEEWRRLGLAATRRQREMLEELRDAERIDSDMFLTLQAELDFSEVALIREEERRMEES